METTLGELAQRLGGTVHGDAQCTVTGVAALKDARAGDVSFYGGPRYRNDLRQTSASAVILVADAVHLCPVFAIVVDNPHVAFARVAEFFNPDARFAGGVHPTAIVGDDVTIEEGAWVGPLTVLEEGARIEGDTYVGPGCYIGANVVVGAHSRLVAHVSVCRGVHIGMRAMIHPGAVVGSDGFGFADDNGVWIKVPQLGSVRIGDDVEIGANTTIDRGALDDTVLEDGVKIDNQVQIGHNVRIGAHTAIAGCVGIAGSVEIGKHCAIGGGAGITGHIRIVDGVKITAMTLVTKSIMEPGLYASGTPAEHSIKWWRRVAHTRDLEGMATKIKILEREISRGKKES